MPDITILTERELRQCVVLGKESIDIIDEAFSRLATGGVIMPPVLSMHLSEVNGEVDVKTAYVPGLNIFAIKMSPGFFDNPAKGLPSLSGLMVALSAETGIVSAVLLDNGYLTDVRTAAAGGVAARYLAPKTVRTAGVIGCGMQARLQARALLLERDVEQLLVWSRNKVAAERYAEEQRGELGIPVTAIDSVESLVRQSQVVVTTTPSPEPFVQAKWLHPGLHITAMGSDSQEKCELEPEILLAADRLVVDRVSQSLERGEMRTAVRAGLMAADAKPDEIGALCAGLVGGRQSEDEITVCDLTGTGVQDTAIANYAWAVAGAKGFGTIIKA